MMSYVLNWNVYGGQAINLMHPCISPHILIIFGNRKSNWKVCSMRATLTRQIIARNCSKIVHLNLRKT